jgi:hypothetical protein
MATAERDLEKRAHRNELRMMKPAKRTKAEMDDFFEQFQTVPDEN